MLVIGERLAISGPLAQGDHAGGHDGGARVEGDINLDRFLPGNLAARRIFSAAGRRRRVINGDAIDALVAELKHLMTHDGWFIPVNLLFRRAGNRLIIQIMASSSDALGMLLVSICVEAELDDAAGLSRRMTAGERGDARDWEYGLSVGRYLTPDRGLYLLVTVSLPVDDLAGVVARLAVHR